MFFIFSKLTGFLVMPLGLWLIYLLCTIKRFKIQLGWSMVGILLFFISSNHFIVQYLIRQWEIPTQKVTLMAPKKVGVVLTGGLFTNDALEEANLHVGSQADRMLQAYKLYRLHKIQKILISGGPIDTLFSKGGSESLLAQKFYKSLGVPEHDIWVENKARNTYENAVYSIDMLKKKGLSAEDVYVITSALHMKRSLGCFHKQGWQVQGFSTNPIAGKKVGWIWLNWIPSHYAFTDLYQYLHECIGYVVYKIMGYL